MDVERVPVGVTGVPAGATNAYVVGRDPALLVDPPARTDALESLVTERSVETVVATHAHPDHVGGLAAIAEAFDLTVVGHRSHGDRLATTGRAPDRLVGEGDAVAPGVTALETPGHAPEHLSLELADGSVVCGDLAIAHGSVVVGAPEGDMRAYLTSLRRLRARHPSRLYPGHGPVIEEPVPTLERLIEHRLERERRVRAAVTDGADSPEAVLEAAYDKDLTGVRNLALATVEAHLEKLAVEGVRLEP